MPERGCMVVCGLNDVARFLEEARRLSDLGVLDVECSADYRRIAGGVKRTLERIRRVTERETLDAGIEIMYGVAGFEDDELHVDGEEMDYDRLIIATGASPLIPPIEGAGNAITYRDILDLNRIPDKLVIIGGGVIAAEFAGIFSSLGSEVTVVSRSGFLSELDPLIREYVSEKILGDVRILEDTSTTEIEGSGVQTSEGYIEGLPLLATGLRPNSDFLKGFLELGPRGGVKVNDRMETSRENVYAAGDVTGGHGTTPVARMEGVVAGLNAAGVERRADYRYLPTQSPSDTMLGSWISQVRVGGKPLYLVLQDRGHSGVLTLVKQGSARLESSMTVLHQPYIQLRRVQGSSCPTSPF